MVSPFPVFLHTDYNAILTRRGPLQCSRLLLIYYSYPYLYPSQPTLQVSQVKFAKNNSFFHFSRFSALCLSAEFGPIRIKSVRITSGENKSGKVVHLRKDKIPILSVSHSMRTYLYTFIPGTGFVFSVTIRKHCLCERTMP